MFLLGLLVARPLSLYDLHRLFGSGVGLIYAASYGSIHRALQQLHESRDVTVDDEEGHPRGRKVYRATARGRGTWAHWMSHLEPGEDAEASMLSRVFLLGLVEEPERRREVLATLRQRAVASLEALRAVDVGGDPAEHYPRAVLAHGLAAAASTVAWIDALLAEIPGRPGAGRPATTTEVVS